MAVAAIALHDGQKLTLFHFITLLTNINLVLWIHFLHTVTEGIRAVWPIVLWRNWRPEIQLPWGCPKKCAIWRAAKTAVSTIWCVCKYTTIIIRTRDLWSEFKLCQVCDYWVEPSTFLQSHNLNLHIRGRGGREVNTNNLLVGQFWIFLPKNPGRSFQTIKIDHVWSISRLGFWQDGAWTMSPFPRLGPFLSLRKLKQFTNLLYSNCLRRESNFLASTRLVTALCMCVCCIVCVCDCIMVIRKPTRK